MSYSIRNVIELTGASEFLLRVWENRYKAFEPKRTKTGRRLYSSDDILKARALVQLTERGMRVGKIAHLPLKELQKIVDGQAAPAEQLSNPKVNDLMNLVHKYKWDEIRALLHSERKRIGGLKWVNTFVIPVLTEMAHQSDTGRLDIPKERLLAAAIQENLTITNLKPSAGRSKSKMIFATLEGDFHDLGLRIAFFIAKEMKIDGLYLGAHVPKRDLSEICLKVKATHLVISSTPSKKVNKSDFLTDLHFLDSNLPPNVSLWVAGRNALAHEISLQRNFQILKSFDHLQEELKQC